MSDNLKIILDEIKSGNRKSIYDLNLTEYDLLSKDDNGISFIEYLLKYNISIPSELIKTNVEIAYIYLKNNESMYNFYLDEDQLFSIINGKPFIEIIANHKNLTSPMIKKVKEHLEIIDIIKNSDNSWLLSYLSTEIIEKLMTKNINGAYNLEKYLNNNDILKYIIPFVNDANKLIEICEKHNNFNLLEHANENVLMNKYNDDKSILMFLLKDKNIIPNKLQKIPENLDFVNYLIKMGLDDYLKNSSEDVLLLEIMPQKTLLELFIEKNINLNLRCVFNEKTVQILYKNNKLDLIEGFSKDILLNSTKNVLNDNNYPDNQTFLEYTLDNNYTPFTGDSYARYNEDIMKLLY